MDGSRIEIVGETEAVLSVEEAEAIFNKVTAAANGNVLSSGWITVTQKGRHNAGETREVFIQTKHISSIRPINASGTDTTIGLVPNTIADRA